MKNIEVLYVLASYCMDFEVSIIHIRMCIKLIEGYYYLALRAIIILQYS